MRLQPKQIGRKHKLAAILIPLCCSVLAVQLFVLNPYLTLPKFPSLYKAQSTSEQESTICTDSFVARHQEQDPPSQPDELESEKMVDAELPTCVKLMQRCPLYADGSFLTSKSTPVVWKKRSDGSKELTLPSTCRLKRYTADQAGMCLKNKHIFFVGDSLSRYTFMSLVYFLDHKKYPMRFQAGLQPCHDHIDENGNPTCSKEDEPNVCVEPDWISIGGWHGYYQAMGGGTDGDVFHGRMESRSYRSSNWPRVPAVDHMQYTRSSEDYGAGNGRTKLSFVYELGRGGWEPFMGFDFRGCGHNATCRYTSEEWQEREKRVIAKDFDWEYPNIVEGFGRNGTKFLTQHQDTNYVIYNRGIWGALQVEKAERMMPLLYELIGGDEGKKGSNNRCFFRSTTGCPLTEKLESWESGPIRNATIEAGCEYFDIAHATEEFYSISNNHTEFKNTFWDRWHYVPWVYEELNNLLLNVLCNAQIPE